MEVSGTLQDYFETGTEGTFWAIYRAKKGFQKTSSYDDLFLLEEGDYLEVYDPESLYRDGIRKVIWSGVIEKDTESMMEESPSNPAYKQQRIGYRWVHWLQKDFVDHSQWLAMFVLGYPAKLIRGEERKENCCKFSIGDYLEHSKGGLYKIIMLPTDCSIESNNEPCYVYKDNKGKLWVRPQIEMEDGRFSLIQSVE